MVRPAGSERFSSSSAAELGVPACIRRISTPRAARRRITSTTEGALRRPVRPPSALAPPASGTSIALKSAVAMSSDVFAFRIPSRTMRW
jgi:hypothetical protein